MLEGFIAGKLAGKAFREDIFKSIKRHAAFAGLIMMIPDFGLGTIVYAIILWHMYKSVAEKCGIDFSEHKGKLITTGLIINIIVAFVIDLAFTAFPIVEPFLVYFQFYLSGKLYVEGLEKLSIEEQNMLIGYDAAADQVNNELFIEHVELTSSNNMKCPGCGEDILEEWVFCENCGLRLKNEPQVSPVSVDDQSQPQILIEEKKEFCSGCGREIPAGSNNCPYCGTKQN